MTYFMFLLMCGLVLGMMIVASNLSPFFAALGLVMVAGLGCGVLVGHGGGFLSLILFLIYLGGMLVVFAYSAALAAESFPEGPGSRPVLILIALYLLGVGFGGGYFVGVGHEFSWTYMVESESFCMVRDDAVGVSMMYLYGGTMLVVSAWVLLLTLLVVLELTRALSRGAIRAV
uniref:NADH-ubiquinone oxidoreductase chain 6 n=1 Tax=Haplophryne mollis TaxID=412653 RepID=D3KSB3_HAPMO|nr:NADH dehydrogenase subunit 6 [Haplophryne mollis]BAI77350.1 NADH dehydrogenase subunit 6 [Haplophryne mollis]